MANLDERNPISSIKGIGTTDNTFFLLSDRVASLNFDGFIPRDNTLVYASDLFAGQTIFSSDPTAKNNSFFITRIDTKDVTVDSVAETAYLLYFLGENDLEEQYTYGAENIDGSFSQNHLFNVYKDDISDIALGNNGWMLTNQGNAIFSNVFVRGTVEATSGKIDGILKVGESKDGNPLVTIGKNIFNSTSFESTTAEHSGIFLDKNNYLMGYDAPTNIPVTSIVATNSTKNNIVRKATFTLAGHTLSVNDLVSISGFSDDKFLELDNVFPVKEVTTDTFTVYYKNEISGTTNPVSVNLKAESFALDNIYDITSMSLTETTTSENVSSVKIYFNGNYTGLFAQDQVIDLNSIVNSSLNINGQYKILSVTEVSGEDNDYLTIQTARVTAGTYTTDIGQITLYNSNYKFKVGNDNNSMSYNSYTGALTVTGTINAHSGNFTDAVTVGKANRSYSVSNKQLTDNVAILTTNSVHSFIVGDSVTVAGVDSTFNGTYTITSVPTAETFTYNKTATNVSSTVVSPAGTVSQGEATDGNIFVGYGASQITISGTETDTTSAIYSGVGNYNNADTGFFMDASGRFSIGDQLYFEDGNLTIAGTVTANSFAIDANNYWNTTGHLGQIRVGDTDNYLYWNGTVLAVNGSDITAPVIIMDAGTLKTSTTVGNGTSASQGAIIDYTSARFYPSNSSTPKTTISNSTGVITATDVNLTGTIKATSGYIGGTSTGWTINSGYIQSSGGTQKITLDATNGKLYIGTGTYGNANTPFYADGSSQFSLGNKLTFTGGNLSITGAINASSGTIGGFLIQNSDLSATTASSLISLTSTGTPGLVIKNYSSPGVTSSKISFDTSGIGFAANDTIVATKFSVDTLTNDITLKLGQSLSAANGGSFVVKNNSDLEIFRLGFNAPDTYSPSYASIVDNTLVVMDEWTDPIDGYYDPSVTIYGKLSVASSVPSYFQDSIEVANRIDADNGIYSANNSIGTLFSGNVYAVRNSGSLSNLDAGVTASSTGYIWAHRDITGLTQSSGYLTAGYLSGAWRGLQFARVITSSGTAMSYTGYVSVALSTTTAPSFAAGSDYRLKTNIETASDDFIDKISSLRLVRFDEVAIPENTNQLGFIAHEVQEIIPEAIEGEKDATDENGDPEYQHIMQVKMLPYLVGALQQSIKKIEDLENRLAALEG